MKNLLLAAVSVAIIGAAASTAHAQDVSWKGAYIAGSAGGATQANNGDETILFDKDLNGTYGDTVLTSGGANAFSPGFSGGAALTNIPSDGFRQDKDGGAFGGRLGYDWQSGKWVFGGLIDLTKYNTNDHVTAYSTTPANYVMSRDLQAILALRARVGYTYGPYLPYITGGAVKGDVFHHFSTTNVANAFTQRGDTDELNGYQAGVGIERHFNNSKWTLGAEYLFTSLKDEDYTVRAYNNGTTLASNPFLIANPAGTDFRRSEDTFNVHTAQITLGYRF